MVTKREYTQTMLGAEVRRLREVIGLTIGELANRTILPQTTVQAIETGRIRYPEAGKLRRIAAALGADYQRLSLLAYGVDINAEQSR